MATGMQFPIDPALLDQAESGSDRYSSDEEDDEEYSNVSASEVEDQDEGDDEEEEEAAAPPRSRQDKGKGRADDVGDNDFECVQRRASLRAL